MILLALQDQRFHQIQEAARIISPSELGDVLPSKERQSISWLKT